MLLDMDILVILDLKWNIKNYKILKNNNSSLT